MFGYTRPGRQSPYGSMGDFSDFTSSVTLLVQMATGMDIIYIVPDLAVQPPHCRPAGSTDPATGLLDPHGNCGHWMAFPFVRAIHSLSSTPCHPLPRFLSGGFSPSALLTSSTVHLGGFVLHPHRVPVVEHDHRNHHGAFRGLEEYRRLGSPGPYTRTPLYTPLTCRVPGPT